MRTHLSPEQRANLAAFDRGVRLAEQTSAHHGRYVLTIDNHRGPTARRSDAAAREAKRWHPSPAR